MEHLKHPAIKMEKYMRSTKIKMKKHSLLFKIKCRVTDMKRNKNGIYEKPRTYLNYTEIYNI